MPESPAKRRIAGRSEGGRVEESSALRSQKCPGACLTAGVPLELVQRVTGHRTVEVVMKHYFRPGREDFRAAIFKAMPKMLADGGQSSAKEEMRGVLERSTVKTWKRDKARLLEVLATI